MKLTKLKLFAGIASFALLFGTTFISCDNGNNATEETVEKTNEELELDNAAFSVLRVLSNLAIFDENAEYETADNGEKELIAGVEILPDDWKSQTFECTEGFVLDPNEPTVRSVPVTNVAEAKEYFSELTGIAKEITDIYKWYKSGLGSLEFRVASDPESTGVYATIDFNIRILPTLTQLRLVDIEVINSSESANAYKGKPYFEAGDIIESADHNTTWMCVRPAGGNLKKDYSYWICLDAYSSSSGTKAQIDKLYGVNKKEYDLKDKDGKLQKKVSWIYANNLMSLATAKAAFHTFSALATHLNPNLIAYDGAKEKYEKLGKTYNVLNLSALQYSSTLLDPKSRQIRFNFAYGKPTTDKTRKTSGKTANAQVKLVQPFLRGSIKETPTDGMNQEELYLHNPDSSSSSLYSVTDAYDYTYSKDLLVDALRKYEVAYDFHNYLHEIASDPFSIRFKDYSYGYIPSTDDSVSHIIFSPELKLADNKGSASEAINPLKNSKKYNVITAYKGDGTFDWWKSFEKTIRYVDDVKVIDWDKEND